MINVQPAFNEIYVPVHLRMKGLMFIRPCHNALCCLNDYEDNKTELNNVLVQPKKRFKIGQTFSLTHKMITFIQYII